MLNLPDETRALRTGSPRAPAACEMLVIAGRCWLGKELTPATATFLIADMMWIGSIGIGLMEFVERWN